MHHSTPAATAPVFSAVDRVLDEAVRLLSFWPEIRDDQHLAPRSARDILATWSHLRRFPEDSVATDTAKQLDQLVRTDLVRLATQALQVPFEAAAWIAEADRLYDCYDRLMDLDEIHELEMNIRDHFDRLDRHSLAADAMNLLLPMTTDSLRRQASSLCTEIERAEEWLRKNPDAFLPMGTLAHAFFQAYRPDLITFDLDLWYATLKYRQVAEDWLVSTQAKHRCPPLCFDHEKERVRQELTALCQQRKGNG